MRDYLAFVLTFFVLAAAAALVVLPIAATALAALQGLMPVLGG